MLEPASRLIYLDELRPPVGYELDRAIATTYSLDLMSVLMVPVSMSMLGVRRDRDGRFDPLGVLEALRRTADKFVVFYQEGRISVSSRQQPLYSFLEPVLIKSSAPNSGAFHPKTWLLRFEPVDDGKPIRYRFLCLSRNLTFDRSWDTALTLEGLLDGRETTLRRNRSLRGFFSDLPNMAMEDLPEKARENIELLADEVSRVEFSVPDDFRDEQDDDLIFRPFGIRQFGIEERQKQILGSAKRLLIVSPFLSDGWLQKGVRRHFPRETTLISRTESLDALKERTYRELVDSGVRIFAVTDMVDGTMSEGQLGTQGNPRAQSISGLHAKMYVVERGREGAQLWTGSANATNAAFSGSNVEFLVGLRWPRKQMAIETLLGGPQSEDSARRNGATTLADLLVPYERRMPEEDPETVTRRRLGEDLETARDNLCEAHLHLSATVGHSGYWDLHLHLADDLMLPDTIKGYCLPVSLGTSEFRKLSTLTDTRKVSFSAVPTHYLTRFIGFHLTASRVGRIVEKRTFVIKLSVAGFPEDRDSMVLREIVKNREGFLRILLLILMDEETEPGVVATLRRPDSGTTAQFLEALGIPLFEELVRASNRQPKKIERISELLEELAEKEDNIKIIPEGFRDLWRVFAEHNDTKQKEDSSG